MSKLFGANERKALMVDMGQARCVREAASMIMLSQTGVEFDEDTFTNVLSNLAAVRQEYGASPDDVQQALETHEPSLKASDA